MVAEIPPAPPKPSEMSRINDRTVLKGQQFCRIILLDGKDYELQIDVRNLLYYFLPRRLHN